MFSKLRVKSWVRDMERGKKIGNILNAGKMRIPSRSGSRADAMPKR